MKHRNMILGFFAFAIALALIMNYVFPKENRACYKSDCFIVELASTEQERAKGLMYRESLGADRGMLFTFEKTGNYPFWMKNTEIPLDMIWMDENKQVVYISRNTQPCATEPCPLIDPRSNAKYVLEVPGGTCDRIGLREGGTLSF